MKAIILCGGKGTRLRPLTYTRSKQLIPVANKPIVEYVLDHLFNAGIKDIGIIVAPETQDEIKKFFNSIVIVQEKKVSISFILQDSPAGLAHAVKTAQGFLGGDPFVMYLGDNLLKDGLRDGVHQFLNSKLDALISLKTVDNPSSFGVAVLNDAGEIKKLVEKPKDPPSNYALVGVYMFSPRIHDAIAQIKPSLRGELEITDAIQKLLEIGGKVKGNILKGWWLDTGKKDDLLSANTVVLDDFIQTEIRGKVDSGTKLTGRIFVDSNAEVINSTIRGPVVIGKGVKVHNSFIGPYSSIGDNSQIINSSIEHSVILKGALIQGISRLEDSLIGEESKVITAQHNHKALRLMIGDSAVVEV